MNNKHTVKKPTFIQAIGSALAALCGIQTRRNLERDMATSSPWPFIIAGLVLGMLFVGTLVGIVVLIVP